ncbi:tetratricopeptide repeat protein [Ancylobacter terrae]|uniref:tetratricopeptide repeat protein n=1 Tax=Ancylobacter sp. sgz301288 TaxID=3342077 RepID=UPI00385D3A0D
MRHASETLHGRGRRRRRSGKPARPEEDQVEARPEPRTVVVPANWGPGRWRLWLFGLLAAGIVWLGYNIALTAFAVYYSANEPERALALRDDNPLALVTLAARDLDLGTAEGRVTARELARKALIAYPLDVRAIRVLALAADAEGDKDTARALMSAASARSRRDLAVDWWLAQDAMQSGDGPRAVQHVDNIMRTRTNVRDDMLPLLLHMLDIPATREPLADSLAKYPPWRAWFFQMLNPTFEYVARGAPLLFEELKTRRAPITESEFRGYMHLLLVNNRDPEAYEMWLRFMLPEERLENLGNVYNGDFAYPIVESPFDWRLTRSKQIAVNVRELGPGAPARRGVVVEFPGGRVTFKGVNQRLALPPGQYQLSGKVRADLITSRGLQWTVTCQKQGDKALGRSELFRGTIAWRDFTSAPFTVPDDCPGQMLTLSLAARVPAEQDIMGTAAFTNLTINRVDRLPDAAIEPAAPPAPGALANPDAQEDLPISDAPEQSAP